MHWKHSKYQILHTIVANCHTYDEAYRVLRELEEDYDLSVKLATAEHKRTNAKEIAANLILADEHETDFNKLNSTADLDTVKARIPSVQSCLNVAVDTLKFLRLCIDKINPHRMYGNLPDHEAHQACQYLEWKLDLIWKSYNMVCASGSMSYDHFINIKLHPESDKLMPVVESFLSTIRDGKHTELLKLTKQDVFAKVVNSNEKFMLPITKTFTGIQYDPIFPGITSADK